MKVASLNVVSKVLQFLPLFHKGDTCWWCDLSAYLCFPATDQLCWVNEQELYKNRSTRPILLAEQKAAPKGPVTRSSEAEKVWNYLLSTREVFSLLPTGEVFSLCLPSQECCKVPAEISKLRSPHPKHVYILLVDWCLWQNEYLTQLLVTAEIFSQTTFETDGTKLPLEILITLEVTRHRLGLEVLKYTFFKYMHWYITLIHNWMWIWGLCCCSCKMPFDFSKTCSKWFGIPGLQEYFSSSTYVKSSNPGIETLGPFFSFYVDESLYRFNHPFYSDKFSTVAAKVLSA